MSLLELKVLYYCIENARIENFKKNTLENISTYNLLEDIKIVYYKEHSGLFYGNVLTMKTNILINSNNKSIINKKLTSYELQTEWVEFNYESTSNLINLKDEITLKQSKFENLEKGINEHNELIQNLLQKQYYWAVDSENAEKISRIKTDDKDIDEEKLFKILLLIIAIK